MHICITWPQWVSYLYISVFCCIFRNWQKDVCSPSAMKWYRTTYVPNQTQMQRRRCQYFPAEQISSQLRPSRYAKCAIFLCVNFRKKFDNLSSVRVFLACNLWCQTVWKLAPGRYGCGFESIILKHIIVIDIFKTQGFITLPSGKCHRTSLMVVSQHWLR